MSAKAAIWARVSTDRQHEDNQIPDLERLCEHRGWEITRRYEIADASAYKGEHRRALQRMLDDAHRGESIWAVDRLCRQGIEELLRLIWELRERNVSLVSHQEPWLNGSDATTELLDSPHPAHQAAGRTLHADTKLTQRLAERENRLRAGQHPGNADGRYRAACTYADRWGLPTPPGRWTTG
jgi:Resolvase, N terminal domain